MKVRKIKQSPPRNHSPSEGKSPNRTPSHHVKHPHHTIPRSCRATFTSEGCSAEVDSILAAMPIGGRKYARVNGRRIERLGICSRRVSLGRIPTSKVSRIVGDEDQRETGSGNPYGACVIVVVSDGFDVKIVLQPAIALEVESQGLTGPSDVPRRRWRCSRQRRLNS